MKAVFSPLPLIGLVLFVGPVIGFNDWLTWHDRQRIEQILLLALLTLSSLAWQRAAIGVLLGRIPARILALWLAGLGLGLISALNSAYPRFAFLEWSSLTLLTWASLTLASHSLNQTENFDRWAYRITAVIALFITLKAAVNYAVALSTGGILDTAQLFSASFSNPRFLGQAATLLLPLLAYPLLSGRLSRPGRSAIFLLLAVFWMLAIASGTRGTWVALALAAMVMTMVSWQASRAWVKFQFYASLTGLLLYAFLFPWLPESALLQDVVVQNRLANPFTLSHRDVLWSLAWQQLLAHPWLGIGPMHFSAIANSVATHPHNALLQLGAEWGMPACLLLIAPFAYGMSVLLKRIRLQPGATDTPLLVCLAASLLAATAQAMVDGVIVMPYTQTLLIFVGGWTLGVYFRSPTESVPVGLARLGRLLAILIPITALGLLAWGVYPETFNRAGITRELVAHGMSYFNPRYWIHGWIP